MENPRTFRIDRGIGQYDFNDYYAVLGLPLTAEASHVRKRYLLIAKSLHPDIHGRTPNEKQIATQYLSKLVNPAYDVLSQERERTEYSAILKLLGKRLMKRNQKFIPQSEIANRYLTAPKDLNYEHTVQEIAKIQYQQLELSLDNIGVLSELNLVYILLQEGYNHSPSASMSSSVAPYASPAQGQGMINKNSTASNSAITGGSVPNSMSSGSNTSNLGSDRTKSSSSNTYQMRSESKVPPRNVNNSTSSSGTTSNGQSSTNGAVGSINQYIQQAEEYINQQLWAFALKELRNAIQIDCNHSKCHALLGFVYMNQKLAGMAKVSFQQALKLNPEEPLALKYITQVGGTTSVNADKNQAKPKSDKKNGFFGWLGGG
ncbi:DnaJ domain-containing protein [Pseudanabaena sp. FACHB-1998]|uniref:DnaJ domain-containing protein n=1 Tax=Pseudanabaena sp. FACHB-1998 TaxID=2692858 RepID=UPI0016806708|nr:DnaJ domain-containing protein [Pseudanabaena sp. FACHB-1998]